MKKIFVAAPFYHWIQDDETKNEKRNILEQLLKSLREQGYKVYNAHEREKWGDAWLDGDICTPLDYKEISDSNLIIAFAGPPISGGVYIELGWSSSMKKKILLILQENEEYSNLVIGLNKITDVKYLYVGGETSTHISKVVLKEIEGWV